MTEITNTPGPKKDDRPFYKKKRFLIIGGLLAIGIVGSQTDKGKNDNITSQITTGHTSPSGHTPGMDLKTRISNNIKSIDGGDDLTNEMTSATHFQIAIAIFKAYASVINEGKKSSDEEILKLTADLEKKVISSQVKNFPKIRKAYYEFVKNNLWEHDVYIDLSGSGNTVLKFTGGFFVTNKNIKTTQKAIHEMLTLLRFKQTQYKWYKGQDDYTYYKMETPKDTDIEE